MEHCQKHPVRHFGRDHLFFVLQKEKDGKKSVSDLDIRSFVICFLHSCRRRGELCSATRNAYAAENGMLYFNDGIVYDFCQQRE